MVKMVGRNRQLNGVASSLMTQHAGSHKHLNYRFLIVTLSPAQRQSRRSTVVLPGFVRFIPAQAPRRILTHF
jgi:hypothetical protein